MKKYESVLSGARLDNENIDGKGKSGEVDFVGNNSDDDDDSFHPSNDDSFIAAFEEASTFISHAMSFHSDMVKRVNPEVDCQDQIYLNQLHGSDETLNEGTLKAMVNGFLDLQLLNETGKDKYDEESPGADEKTVFFYGDLLTDILCQKMRPYVRKSRTKVGWEDWVMKISGAIDRCVFQHDYMHETFHMLEAIYNQFFGGFLQPLRSFEQSIRRREDRGSSQ